VATGGSSIVIRVATLRRIVSSALTFAVIVVVVFIVVVVVVVVVRLAFGPRLRCATHASRIS
jgi:heme/copper-type cytochrome/quinol oxidase subunit 2